MDVSTFVRKYFPGVPFKHGKVKCPCHDDVRASLAIRISPKTGKILLNCHAGCSFTSIARAISLDSADLNGAAPRVKANPKQRSFPTPQSVIDAYEQSLDARYQATYVYRTVSGKEVRVLRFQGKQFRQMSATEDGRWVMSLPDELIEPYLLEDCSAGGPIWVDESEKACEALRRAGVSATSTIMGASSLKRTNLDPLRGRKVYVWPHNDDGGMEYAEALEEELGAVVLPQWGEEHQDVEDWLAAGGTAEELWRIAATWSDDVPVDAAPVLVRHAMPPVLWSLSEGIASATGCGQDVALLCLYPVIATAIGTKTVVEVKPGFTQPASVYAAIWGDTGDGKSHPMAHAVKPLRDEQRRRTVAFKLEEGRFEQRLVEYSKLVQDYKRGKYPQAPKKPEPPVLDALVVDDTTIEAMEHQLVHGTGKLVFIDEGIQWYCGAGQYKSGGGSSDKAKYCSWWNGSGTFTLRAKEMRITSDQLAVSMLMGCQTKAMSAALKGEDLSIGLFGRMLMALMPPRSAAPQLLDPEVQTGLEDLVELLLGLDPPKVLPVGEGVAEFWDEHVHPWQQQEKLADMTGMRGAFAKLAAYVARLALLHHVIDMAVHGAPPVVPLGRFEDAFELVKRWQVPVQRQAYFQLAMTGKDHDLRHYRDLILAMGGYVTSRDLCRKARITRKVAENVMTGLVRMNWGRVLRAGEPGGEQLRKGQTAFICLDLSQGL